MAIARRKTVGISRNKRFLGHLTDFQGPKYEKRPQREVFFYILSAFNYS